MRRQQQGDPRGPSRIARELGKAKGWGKWASFCLVLAGLGGGGRRPPRRGEYAGSRAKQEEVAMRLLGCVSYRRKKEMEPCCPTAVGIIIFIVVAVMTFCLARCPAYVP